MAASTIQIVGALGFGLLIGWNAYFINRYRKADVQISDLATIIGVIGGGAVLSLFEAKTDLFGYYGLGLAIGFFAYFATLLIMVSKSENFDLDWFLDGRRKKPKDDQIIPVDVAGTVHPMEVPNTLHKV